MEIKLEQHGSAENNGTIVELLVEKGQEVKKDQLLLVLEFDKTNLEIESPIDGNIKEIFFSINDSVNVGQTILIIE
tara:strand:- start:283 stop:510 length:228 start_codon:yes stop_codon:yes gene_type:complete